ncbi:MAG: hypothetical protein WA071_26995 [Undibacterium umbellatum]|uniref:hypothetical protein n=1 Tax=Undibacterium umbellatum TaxID=2762300 RepID=UPI003BB7C845
MDLEIIKAKIQDLKRNQEAGEAQMLDMEQKRRELQATLIRISGAIQVLEELIFEHEQATKN